MMNIFIIAVAVGRCFENRRKFSTRVLLLVCNIMAAVMVWSSTDETGWLAGRRRDFSLF